MTWRAGCLEVAGESMDRGVVNGWLWASGASAKMLMVPNPLCGSRVISFLTFTCLLLLFSLYMDHAGHQKFSSGVA